MAEIIGITLAAYPLVIRAFKQYKKGATYLEYWIHFRRGYKYLKHDIETQERMFKETIYNIMCRGQDPYFDVEDDKEAFSRFIRDPSGWNDPRLRVKLITRLGEENYRWFLAHVERINTALLELEELFICATDQREQFAMNDKKTHWWKFQRNIAGCTLFAQENRMKWEEAKRLNDDLLKLVEIHDTIQIIGTHTPCKVALQ